MIKNVNNENLKEKLVNEIVENCRYLCCRNYCFDYEDVIKILKSLSIEELEELKEVLIEDKDEDKVLSTLYLLTEGYKFEEAIDLADFIGVFPTEGDLMSYYMDKYDWDLVIKELKNMEEAKDIEDIEKEVSEITRDEIYDELYERGISTCFMDEIIYDGLRDDENDIKEIILSIIKKRKNK